MDPLDSLAAIVLLSLVKEDNTVNCEDANKEQ